MDAEKYRNQKKAYREANREKIALHEKTRNYGLDDGVLLELMGRQDSRCKICQTPININSAHVDHCHSCDNVRGLLCLTCNVCLGMFHDDPALLRRAITYLKKHHANK